MTRTYVVTSEWRARAEIEVDDGVELTNDINAWPEDVLEQVTSAGAELVDWEVSGG